MQNYVLCVIAFILVLIRSVQYLFKKYKINRWVQSLNLKQHAAVFEDIFRHTNGFLLSKQARQQGDAFDYTYGEIEFLSFIALLSLTHPNENTRFYDLGSGIGKAIVACALVFDVENCCGIELFHELHASALAQRKYLEKLPHYEDKAQRIEFIQGDLLNADLSTATLIFINSTAFIGDFWDELSQKLAETAVGSTIITISKKLSGSAFEVKHTTQVNMSWGVATAYIQEYQYQHQE